VEPEGSKNSTASRRPIGAHRDDWDKLFWTGMLEADVMIMVLNREYVASQWCLKEWGQFADNNHIRYTEGRKPLLGVAMQLDETPIPIADMQCFVTPLKVSKYFGRKSIFAWDEGDYTLNESDMCRLIKAIGPLR
ncbi:MAG TPA: TIR domain-containing protein, partial [Pirellulales bacterium]|nr:TIR domain-containing protein [Pirellulales bacterium]